MLRHPTNHPRRRRAPAALTVASPGGTPRRRTVPLILALVFGTAGAVLPATPAAAPEGPRIEALLEPPATRYEARGFGEDHPDPLTGTLLYLWQGQGLDCGTLFTGPPEVPDPRFAVWYHGSDPAFPDDACPPHTTSHSGTIRLHVSSMGLPLFTCEYKQGSVSGDSHCTEAEVPGEGGEGKAPTKMIVDDDMECPDAVIDNIQAAVNGADVDADGDVDVDDVVQFMRNPAQFDDSDFNDDGSVDLADFNALRKLGEKPKIDVCEGTYKENVNIPPGRKVDIVGAGPGKTIVNPVPHTPGPAFFADNADEVNISGVTVDGRGMMGGDDATGHSWGISYAGTDGKLQDVEVLNINQAANGVMGIGIQVLPNDAPVVQLDGVLISKFTYAGVVGMGQGVHVDIKNTDIIGPPMPVTGPLFGIKLHEAEGTVKSTDIWTLHTDSGGGTGVYLNGADGSKVEKTKVWDVDTGFRVENTEGAEIKDNWVKGATHYGAELVQSGDGVLHGNDITNNWLYDIGHDGAVVRGSNSSLITGNTFSKNWFEQTGACGISLFHGTETLVKKNWFKDIGVHAMHVAGASSNRFDHNRAWDVGGNGISMEMGTWNRFTHNTIWDVERNGALVQDGWNYFVKNRITGSDQSGIKNEATAEDNTYEKNTVRDSGQFDAWDESSDGGTAGTANVWKKNDCETDMPAGLCKSKKKKK